MKPTIAIAGASGFIGRWFIEKYHQDFNIIALSRKELIGEERPNITWRKVDLYSLSSTSEALKGADYAFYLVHSMQPSTRLNQGSFEDTDLLLADNFSRSAQACGIKQIIYVGGILPKDPNDFSRHLRSRYEVEQTLGARSTPVTALRAGIIIGPGGSSFTIVEKLVKRLPAMACPKWTTSYSQPIDVDDVMKIMVQCIGNEKTVNQSIEIGGPLRITYMNLLKKTAAKMGYNRWIFSVPFFTLGLSKLWVGLFSDSSPVFVGPLIESLRHDMTIEDDQKVTFDINYISLDDSILKSIKGKAPVVPTRSIAVQERNTVRSVQRLPNPAGKTANWVADEYQHWLPRLFRYFMTVVEKEDIVSFNLLGIKLLELKIVHDRSDQDRQLFYIVGGQLVKQTNQGWLEFRSVLDNKFVIAAIHEFVPRLPWFIYRNTQARVHLWVMNRYGDFLKTL